MVVKDRQYLPVLEWYKQYIAGKEVWNYSKSRQPVCVKVPEYLQLELSLPKWALGVNFIPTSWEEDYVMLQDLREWLKGLTQNDLPPIDQWLLSRIDCFKGFLYESEETLLDHFGQMRNTSYVKRQCIPYKTGIYAKGTTTTTKLYGKFEEFKKHDRKRLTKFLGRDIVEAIHSLTKGLLRFEVEHKQKWLSYRNIHTIKELFENTQLIEDNMIIELKKIYGGLKNRKPQTLPELIEVINQFEWKGTGVTSGSVISVLTVLSQQGKNEAIKQFGKDKYYRVIRIANERGLGLIRGLENIEKKDLDQAQVIDIEDYRVKDTTVRKAYEFLLFGVQQ